MRGPKDFKEWFSALWSETFFRYWTILSAISTFSTYFWPNGPSGQLRVVIAGSFVASFIWAHFRVFQKQRRRIEELSTSIASREIRAAELKITAYGGSYLLTPVAGISHGDFNGGYVILQLRIDNSGLRRSIVDKYRIEVVELGAAFENLQPEEGRRGIRGRHSQQGLDPDLVLSETQMVTINAEDATRRGDLIFFLRGLTLDQFLQAGLTMTGDERRFGSLHCRLTITDTMGASAIAEFELHEG